MGNLRYKDSYEDSCEDYYGNKHWCGNYDTSDFKSNEHCCACGGGKGGKPTCTFKTFDIGNYECDWNNVDKKDRSSYGSLTTIENCQKACENRVNCNFFSFTAGYCHMFKTCNGRMNPVGWKTYQKSC